MSARDFFTENERLAIVQAIEVAERNTSGEIKLHLEDHCGKDVLKKAVAVFHRLQLQKTAQRNAVLIYLAVKDRQFAIIADKGIDEKVPADFWNNIKEDMQEEFSGERFLNGILLGIEQSGLQLKKYFPFESGDSNELSDEISFND